MYVCKNREFKELRDFSDKGRNFTSVSCSSAFHSCSFLETVAPIYAKNQPQVLASWSIELDKNGYFKE